MSASGTGGWLLYLRALSATLVLALLSLVVLPDVGEAAFSLLVDQQQDVPADFSDEAVSHLRLAHAVLGAVMAGWFAMVLWLAGLLATVPRAWSGLVLALAVCFVPDTAYSLLSGYGETRRNVVVLGLFVPALLGTRPARQRGR